MEGELYVMKYKMKNPFLTILGHYFVINNRNKAKLIINNKKYNLQEFYEIKDDDQGLIKVKIFLNKNIYNKSYMFENCETLITISMKDNSEYSIDDNNYSDMENIENFNIYESTEEINNYYNDNFEEFEFFEDNYESIFYNNYDGNISDIINTTKISIENNLTIKNCLKKFELKGHKYLNLKNIFYNCYSLTSLPDLFKGNNYKIIDASGMFYKCLSLKSLPDISEFDTNNLIDMSLMFFWCKSIKSLPDISKWNTKNVTDMSSWFDNCILLSSLPDIS